MSMLKGIRVVELTEALAGPYSAMMLGDMGADVVKVERPGCGDQSRSWGPPFVGTESAYFLATNRNKRSIALNYDEAKGGEILRRLLACADVFLCNQPSLASLKRRGLDPETLRAKFPRLIYCSVTGYGFSGPKAGQPGYDILAQAEAGVMSITGEPDDGPMRFPIAIADMTTGLYATIGILGALYARERTGKGDFLDMALLDSQLTWLANVGSNYLNAGVVPERLGNAHPSIVPYQLFRGSDEKYFVVGVGTQALWTRLMKLMDAEEIAGDERFASNPARIEHREELTTKLQEYFSRSSAAEWQARLAAADIPTAAIHTVAEALEFPQCLARGMVVEIVHPTLQKARSIANPVKSAEHTIEYRLPPPLLGEHSAEIIKELGLSESALEARSA